MLNFPDDDSSCGIIDPEGVHNRTIRCFVGHVDTNDGFVKLDFADLPSAGRFATVPPLFASFPDATHQAWGRYMPFENDILKVSFDYNDRPHVVGYDVIGNSEQLKIADGRVGWPIMSQAAKDGVLPMFRPLNSGEYDFMSSGGAYIWGSDDGQLLLAANETSLTISKAATSIEGDAAEYLFGSYPSMIRFGQVRRPLATAPDEAAGTTLTPNPLARWNTDGTKNEFQVEVNYMPTGTLPVLSVSRFAMGHVATDLGPDLAATGAPRRLAMETWDISGVNKNFIFETDNLGSCHVKVGLNNSVEVIAASTLKVGTSHTETFGASLDTTVGTSYKLKVGGNTDISGTGAVKVTSAASITLTAPTVAIGATPAGGILNGDRLATALAPLTAMAASLAAAGLSMSTPPLSAVPVLHGELGAQLTIIATALQDILAAIPVATSKTVTVSL